MIQRAVYPTPAESLPLQMETIGINPDQEYIQRPNGYPFYHWLQTIEGEGTLELPNTSIKLSPHSGILLHPHVPHSYRTKTSGWKTAYITFTGMLAQSLTAELLGSASERIHWDRNDKEITPLFERILTIAEAGTDASGWRSSAELYRFLTLLRTHGRKNHHPSLSNRLAKVQKLLNWLETQYANPSLGLAQMAEQLNIGERQLNERFKEIFGQTAYAYLIQLRLRKAKEKLPSSPELTVRQIGEAVGFRDASHFVATFRQREGLTPENYRRLHGAFSL